MAGCAWCGCDMRRWQHVPLDPIAATSVSHQDVYWCDGCGVGAVHPVPSPEEVAQFYRLAAYYTHGTAHSVEGEPYGLLDKVRVKLAVKLDRGTPMTATFIHRALGRKARRICDVGAGSGNLAAALAGYGHEVVAVEVDPESVVRQHGQRITTFAGTAESLPPEVTSRQFDCVLLSHVLEHCRDPRLALRNVRALLAPGGLLIAEVPNNEALTLRDVGCAWSMFDAPRHLTFFTRRSLRSACEDAGFSVTRTFHAHYHRQFTNGWIGTEQKLFANVTSNGTRPSPAPKRNSRALAWQLLAKTALAPADRKYDSIGVFARTAA